MPTDSLMFIFEDDAFQAIRGISPVDTSPIELAPQLQRGVAATTASDIDNHADDRDHDKASPHQPTSPPTPPAKLPSRPGRSDYLTDDTELARAVLFPDLYGIRPPTIDVEALVERSVSPIGDPFADSDSEAAFEALHNEFMDSIRLGAPVSNNIWRPPASRGPNGKPSPPQTNDSDDEPPKTPNVTKPLRIRKNNTPSPQKRTIELPSEHRQIPTRASVPRRVSRPLPPIRVSRPLPPIPVSPTSHERAANRYRYPASPRPVKYVPFIPPPKQASTPLSAEEKMGFNLPRAGPIDVPLDPEDFPSREPSPSPPLIRTPNTPPTVTLPSPAAFLLKPKESIPPIHARRQSNRLKLAKRVANVCEMGGASSSEEDRAETGHTDVDDDQAAPLEARHCQSRPLPALTIPPLALGPLPPVPTSAPARAGRSFTPSMAPCTPTWPSAMGPMAPLLPSPPPPPPSTASLSPPLFPRSDSRNSGFSGFSTRQTLNRSGTVSSNGSDRRPMSMQPQPSPREFGLMAGPLTRARMEANGFAFQQGNRLSPGFARPASTISYHFGPITIPGSSPVVQAFEDIGSIGIIGPTSPFTHPRPAPRPLVPMAAFGGNDDWGFPGNTKGSGSNAPGGANNFADPVCAITPTAPPISSSPPGGSGEIIPPKARALLGLVSSPPEVPAEKEKTKKPSRFGAKVSDLVRGVRHNDATKEGYNSLESPRSGKGRAGRRRTSFVAETDVKDRSPYIERAARKVSAPEYQPPSLWRTQTAESQKDWSDSYSFAPLSGHAQTQSGKGSAKLNLFGRSERDRDRERERERERDSDRQPERVYERYDRSDYEFDPPVRPASRHMHSNSFGSAQSFPTSVAAESTYPASVLSNKSSFELPRPHSPPKVRASPKLVPSHLASSYVSSVDGGFSVAHTPAAKVYGGTSPPKATATAHKGKSSLDGIPNLTPNSKAGVYSPPASDHKMFKIQTAYHAPSLSPIVYAPPKLERKDKTKDKKTKGNGRTRPNLRTDSPAPHPVPPPPQRTQTDKDAEAAADRGAGYAELAALFPLPPAPADPNLPPRSSSFAAVEAIATRSGASLGGSSLRRCDSPLAGSTDNDNDDVGEHDIENDSEGSSAGRRARPPPITVPAHAHARSASGSTPGSDPSSGSSPQSKSTKSKSKTHPAPNDRHKHTHAASASASTSTSSAGQSQSAGLPPSYSPPLAALSHKTTNSADRYPYTRHHVPSNLHLRAGTEKGKVHAHPVHPSTGPRTSGSTSTKGKGKPAGTSTSTVTVVATGSTPAQALTMRSSEDPDFDGRTRPRVPSRTSLIEESYFEPDTPSPARPTHFLGLRNVVKGWENRI